MRWRAETMPVGRAGHPLKPIEILWSEGTLTGMEDRQLLERFVARDESCAEAAFAILVRRHGPMVLRVCQQLLGDRHAAEDAFQATFLVLARKAGSLRQPDFLGRWLYGVALRTARRARMSREPGDGGGIRLVPDEAEEPHWRSGAE